MYMCACAFYCITNSSNVYIISYIYIYYTCGLAPVAFSQLLSQYRPWPNHPGHKGRAVLNEVTSCQAVWISRSF